MFQKQVSLVAAIRSRVRIVIQLKAGPETALPLFQLNLKIHCPVAIDLPIMKNSLTMHLRRQMQSDSMMMDSYITPFWPDSLF